MKGVNFVELVGKIVYPSFKTVGADSKLFKAKLAIPLPDKAGKFQYLKIAGWRETAEALNDVSNDSYIKINGHIEERSYDGKCRNCDGTERKYWTEVVVDYFKVINEEEGYSNG